MFGIKTKKDNNMAIDYDTLNGSGGVHIHCKVINRGNCMLCGKELTKGVFFCEECHKRAEREERKDIE